MYEMFYTVIMYVKIKKNMEGNRTPEMITSLDKVVLRMSYHGLQPYYYAYVKGVSVDSKENDVCEYNISKDEYERLERLMFKSNKQEAEEAKMNSGVEWTKWTEGDLRDMDLLDGLEV